jgi:hypothetical protein
MTENQLNNFTLQILIRTNIIICHEISKCDLRIKFSHQMKSYSLSSSLTITKKENFPIPSIVCEARMDSSGQGVTVHPMFIES